MWRVVIATRLQPTINKKNAVKLTLCKCIILNKQTTQKVIIKRERRRNVFRDVYNIKEHVVYTNKKRKYIFRARRVVARERSTEKTIENDDGG